MAETSGWTFQRVIVRHVFHKQWQLPWFKKMCMLLPGPLNAPRSFSIQFLQQLFASLCISCRMDLWRCKRRGVARLRADRPMGVVGGVGWGLHGAGTTREAPEKTAGRSGREEERGGGRTRGTERGRKAQGSPCCRVCTQEWGSCLSSTSAASPLHIAAAAQPLPSFQLEWKTS